MSSCSHSTAHALESSPLRAGAELSAVATSEAEQRTFLDRVGAVLGFLCAIHCLAVPLFLGALPALGFLADHAFDLTLIGVAAIVAFFSARSGLRSHGDRRVALGFLGAVVLLALGHILGEDDLAGRIPSVIGGFTLFGLHLVNLRLSRRACC